MRRAAVLLLSLAVLVACAAPAESPPRAGATNSEPSESIIGSTASSLDRGVCAAREVGLGEVLELPVEERVNCFGDRPISFRAYISSMVGAGTVPEQLSPGDGWLDPYTTPRRLLIAVPGETEQVLAALLPPGMSPEDIRIERWAIVTGHFDDPASLTCGRIGRDGVPRIDADTVGACQSLFVIEGVRPADG